MPISFQAKVPGSKMIAGEYAVLHGQAAIACAINKYITCTLTPNTDKQVNIHSTLGEYHIQLDKITIEKPFEYVLASILSVIHHITLGFDLVITSDLSTQFGLGSSAATTLSVLACLHSWLNLPLDTSPLIAEAIKVIHQVQGAGSGADVAASAYGGLVYYKMEQQVVEPLPMLNDVHFIYSGKKASTKQAIKFMRQQYQENPSKLDAKFNSIGECVEQAKRSIINQDTNTLGSALNKQSKLMIDLNVSCDSIDLILQSLAKLPNIQGAKISGAGFGDCVLALGKLADNHFPENSQQQQLNIKQLALNVSTSGLEISEHE